MADQEDPLRIERQRIRRLIYLRWLSLDPAHQRAMFLKERYRWQKELRASLERKPVKNASLDYGAMGGVVLGLTKIMFNLLNKGARRR